MSENEKPQSDPAVETDAEISVEAEATTEGDDPTGEPVRWGRLQDVLLALVFLTRLPITLSGTPPEGATARMTAWFPLVGLVVGAIGSAVYALAWWCGASSAVAAILTIAAMVLTTGAMHEDGLADTFDGLGGGRSRERKLEIMRDSRLGSYGAIALGLALAARAAVLADLEQPWDVLRALIAAGVWSRVALPMIAVFLDPARPGGLARMCGRPPKAEAAFAVVFGAVVMIATLGTLSAAAMALGALAAGVVAAVARRQIGGHTGDVLGAAQQISEVAVLVMLSMVDG